MVTASDVNNRKPVPEPDEVSRPFFEGATQRQLMIQRCEACRAAVHPGSAVCPECLAESPPWEVASGKGRIHTFGIMHQRYHPGFADEIPYVVAVIELDEGLRINSNIVGTDPHRVQVGDPVGVVFDQVAEGIWLPKFRVI